MHHVRGDEIPEKQPMHIGINFLGVIALFFSVLAGVAAIDQLTIARTSVAYHPLTLVSEKWIIPVVVGVPSLSPPSHSDHHHEKQKE
jgi:hypothetical protein